MQQPEPSHPYRVAVAIAVHLYDLLDYQLSASEYAAAQIGARVLVPFRNKEVVGVIVEKKSPQIAFLNTFKLKPIRKLLDQQPLLDPQCLALLSWAAQYYQSPIGEVILSALPNMLRQGRPYDLLSHYWQVTAIDASPLLKHAPKQLAAYQSIQLHPHGVAESILNLMGIATAQLNALAQKNCIEKSIRPIDFRPTPMQLAQMPLDANPEQASAIEQIQHSIGRYQAFLLDGITGSGKTEVYLQAMQAVLALEQQVLILVPEIGLTPQTIERFHARFHVNIVVLHSGLNDSQRLQAWQQAQMGKASIILGTRLAVFCPLPRLGMIILDEEHDLSYKQQDTFRYHARDVALYRALKQHCPVVLGSATPSFESLALVQQAKMQHLRLRQRAGQATVPSLQLIDLKTARKTEGLANSLIAAIGQTLAAEQQVLVFINRRGYAPILICTACAWQADCPHCDAHLSVHYQPHASLRCHHCGHQQRLPQQCPHCGTTEIKPLGLATARLEETLAQLFPDRPILRVDRDSTSRVNSWQKIYQRALQPGAAIFLGTQMLAKGHHFPHVALVTILDIDAGLLSSDFRAPERTAQLIMQVAGRAGRAEVPGQVLLQSVRPEHPLLQILVKHGYGRFAEHALQERQQAQIPPFAYAALIRAESKDAPYNLAFLQHAIDMWPQFGDTAVQIWGPTEAPMQKKAGFFRCHLLLFSTSRMALQRQIMPWWQWLFKQPRLQQLRLTLDIDPQDLS
jgi:primosomal protein N' (replication factor Y)